MNAEEAIKQMKDIQSIFLDFLDKESNAEINHEKLLKVISDYKITEEKHKFISLLQLINVIGNNHRRFANFISKIERTLQNFKTDIHKYLTNFEIFDLFKNNKRILLYFIQEQILIIDSSTVTEITEQFEFPCYPQYFAPEIKQYITNEFIESYYQKHSGSTHIEWIDQVIKNEIQKDFYEKRIKGENDDLLSEIIRNDNIKEFSNYITEKKIPLDSHIYRSIFETNPLLMMNKKIKLINYAAFYGSIEIFKFLHLNGCKTNSKIWLYAIHSKNFELIQYIESNQIPFPNKLKVRLFKTSFCGCSSYENGYEVLLDESINCHHNELANYIIQTKSNPNIDQNDYEHNIYCYCFKSHNYLFLPEIIDCKYTFFYLCQFNYYTLINLYLQTGKIDVNETCHKISFFNLFIYMPALNFAAISNNQEIVELLLKQKGIEIKKFAFFGCSLLQKITIPSSITSIGYSAFSDCLSLKSVTFEIPSSVTVFEMGSFKGCSALTEIFIPSSVKSIGSRAFKKCSSLEKVTFETPSSLMIIESEAFIDCCSLTQITIPQSVTEIGNDAFRRCSSLKQIKIPIEINIGKGVLPSNVEIIFYYMEDNDVHIASRYYKK